MVVPEKPTLYVLQLVDTIAVQWETQPNLARQGRRWYADKYSHPDVNIEISKSRNVQYFDHNGIAYQIMLALQDATIAVAPLKREKTQYTRRKVKEDIHVQLPLI